jgi:hypothetical protein
MPAPFGAKDADKTTKGKRKLKLRKGAGKARAGAKWARGKAKKGSRVALLDVDNDVADLKPHKRRKGKYAKPVDADMHPPPLKEGKPPRRPRHKPKKPEWKSLKPKVKKGRKHK